MSKDTLQVLGWSALIVIGLAVAVFCWQTILIALAIFLLLGTALAVIVAIPTFLVTLCLEWSLKKASQRAGTAILCCYALVADIISKAA